jgi:hypothetical protein
MSAVWDTLIEIEKYFESKFYATGSIISEPGMDRFNQPGWVNKVWASSVYRRAHIDVVDARETKGLWMMHCCIFPHLHNPGPIFGFDVIAGKNKITGCFIDFSPAGDPNHSLIEWFGDEVAKLEWRKVRPLPDWAQRIFTKHMVAAGNIQEQAELDQILDLGKLCVNTYLDVIGETNKTADNTSEAQDFYCTNQKQNPHTPRVMTSLGLSEEDVTMFIQDCLFPNLKK